MAAARSLDEVVNDFISRFNASGRDFEKRNEIACAMGYSGYAYGDNPFPSEARRIISRHGGAHTQKLARDAKQGELFGEEGDTITEVSKPAPRGMPIPKGMRRERVTPPDIFSGPDEYELQTAVAVKKAKRTRRTRT